MVKKLFKHEFLAWLRVLPIIYGAVLALAGMHRIIQIFEADSIYYTLVSGSATLVYCIALFVCLTAPDVFGVVRYYKNFFTGEGYLTFTLPVSTAEHLWVKLVTATTFSLISLLVCLVSVPIITAGDVFTELCKAGAYIAGKIPSDAIGHLIGYCAELFAFILAAMCGGHLLYSTCICIGQLARKNRILAAVGVYFGFYFAAQILSTILSVVFMILTAAGAFDGVVEFASAHPVATIHIALCVGIAVQLLLAGVFWLICHSIIRKKLNLE